MDGTDGMDGTAGSGRAVGGAEHIPAGPDLATGSSSAWYGPTARAPTSRSAAQTVTWLAESTGIRNSASSCGITSYVGRFVQLMKSASAAPTTACRAMSTTSR